VAAVKKFFEKLKHLVEIAKISWLEGTRHWCYEDYKNIL